MFFQSADLMRKEGRKYADKAIWNAQNIERANQDIEEIEQKIKRNK